MTVHLRQVSGSGSDAAIRNHTIRIDRPSEKGGSDTGPMGGELFLAAIGGCFMSNLLAAIKAREAPVSDASVEVSAPLEGTPPRFTRFELLVSARYSDPELMRKLVDIADRGCIMMNSLRGKFDVNITTAPVLP